MSVSSLVANQAEAPPRNDLGALKAQQQSALSSGDYASGRPPTSVGKTMAAGKTSQDCDNWVLATMGVDPRKFEVLAPDSALSMPPDSVFAKPSAVAGPRITRPTGPQEAWSLERLLIEPESPSIDAGTIQQFTVQGLYAGGHNQPETEALEWRSSDTELAWPDETTKGVVIAGPRPGRVTITAKEPNSKQTVSTILTIQASRSEMMANDLDEGEAYRWGLEDGRYGDPDRRSLLEARQEPKLIAAYNDGYQKAKAESDSQWDSIGTEVDKLDIGKRPEQEPVMSPTDKVLTGAGVISTIVSILEGNRAAAFSRGLVGTSIGAVLLPILAFKVGTDIAQNREDYRNAVNEFTMKFVATTTYYALERAQALVKAAGSPQPDLNDAGKRFATDLYKRIRAELDSTLRDYIGDKKEEQAFVALHKAYVAKMSKLWADIMVNPRFAPK